MPVDSRDPALRRVLRKAPDCPRCARLGRSTRGRVTTPLTTRSLRRAFRVGKCDLPPGLDDWIGVLGQLSHGRHQEGRHGHVRRERQGLGRRQPERQPTIAREPTLPRNVRQYPRSKMRASSTEAIRSEVGSLWRIIPALIAWSTCVDHGRLNERRLPVRATPGRSESQLRTALGQRARTAIRDLRRRGVGSVESREVVAHVSSRPVRGRLPYWDH